MAWQEILPGEIGVGKPVTQEFLDKLTSREQALRERTFRPKFAPVTVTVGSEGTFFALRMPTYTEKLDVHLQVYYSASPFGANVPEARIIQWNGVTRNEGAWKQVPLVVAPTLFELTVIAAHRGGLIDLILGARDIGGSPSGTITVQNIRNDALAHVDGYGIRQWA